MKFTPRVMTAQDFKPGAILENTEYKSKYRVIDYNGRTEWGVVNEKGEEITIDTREAHWYTLLKPGVVKQYVTPEFNANLKTGVVYNPQKNTRESVLIDGVTGKVVGFDDVTPFYPATCAQDVIDAGKPFGSACG